MAPKKVAAKAAAPATKGDAPADGRKPLPPQLKAMYDRQQAKIKLLKEGPKPTPKDYSTPRLTTQERIARRRSARDKRRKQLAKKAAAQ
eukprot:NODE_3152_length_403_cov_1079.387006_g2526_i0.p1 GENE.NODE_3152_length_403_cov_1079.387006_g2526_i0~~NODE_3152_length_403_cov_1079.387006_g2526_i0.p1  ORF type:complete len:89 (+),score=23.71 NODE_3152_length_403_cov_1079.387006_g2526_i0:73-339(+)